MTGSTQVQHEAGASRFTSTVDGERALLEYRRDGDIMVITHTRVPAAIGGRGIAGGLVEAALAHARAAGWKVEPQCSYAAAHLQRHPEHRDLVA